MKIPRQARIESSLLLALRESDAASVAELARRVGASRASTSRAFAALGRKGLVQTDGRRRSLTDAGRQAADDLFEPSGVVRRAVAADQRHIRTMVERAQVKHFLGNTVMFDTLQRLKERVALTSQLASGPTALRLAAAYPMADVMRSSMLPEFSAVKHIAELELGALQTIKVKDVAAMLPDAGTRSAIDDIARRFADMPIAKGAFANLVPGVSPATLNALAQIGASAADRDLSSFVATTSMLGRELAASQAIGLGRGVAAATDSIRLQLDALGPAMLARPEWVSLLTESMSVGSKIVGDASAIAAFMDASNARTSRIYNRLAATVNPLIEANRDNAAAELGLIAGASPGERTPMFLTPSLTTSRLTGVALLILDRDEQHAGTDLPDAGDLFDLLGARGMSWAIRDLRGARDAVTRLPDGWAKTTAHLLREAMREVLSGLVRDEDIPNPNTVRVTRRMRVAFAIGGGSKTLAAVIDGASMGWEHMADFLSAEAHNDHDSRLNRAGMIGCVIAVEGTIRMLIAAHEIGKRGST